MFTFWLDISNETLKSAWTPNTFLESSLSAAVIGSVPWWVSTTCEALRVCACHCSEPVWGAPHTPAQASSLWHFWPFPTLPPLQWSLSHPSEPDMDGMNSQMLSNVYIIGKKTARSLSLWIYLKYIHASLNVGAINLRFSYWWKFPTTWFVHGLLETRKLYICALTSILLIPPTPLPP